MFRLRHVVLLLLTLQVTSSFPTAGHIQSRNAEPAPPGGSVWRTSSEYEDLHTGDVVPVTEEASGSRPPRAAAVLPETTGIIALDENKYWVVLVKPKNDKAVRSWMLPTSKVGDGENLNEALIRTGREEAGVVGLPGDKVGGGKTASGAKAQYFEMYGVNYMDVWVKDGWEKTWATWDVAKAFLISPDEVKILKRSSLRQKES